MPAFAHHARAHHTHAHTTRTSSQPYPNLGMVCIEPAVCDCAQSSNKNKFLCGRAVTISGDCAPPSNFLHESCAVRAACTPRSIAYIVASPRAEIGGACLRRLWTCRNNFCNYGFMSERIQMISYLQYGSAMRLSASRTCFVAHTIL